MRCDLPEIVQCDVVVFETRWAQRFHCAIRHELLHILDGETALHYPDGRTFRAGRGDTLVIPKGQLHKDEFSPRRDLRVLFVEFDWPSGSDHLARLDNARLARLGSEVRGEVREICEHLRNAEPDALNDARLYTILLSLEQGLSALPAPPPAVSPANRLVERAKRYIERNFAARLSLGEIAASLGVSPSHLSRTFGANCELTLTEYIQSVRIAEAKRLLRDSGCTVAEAAARTGFDNPNYFARVFRRQTGVAPGKFR